MPLPQPLGWRTITRIKPSPAITMLANCQSVSRSDKLKEEAVFCECKKSVNANPAATSKLIKVVATSAGRLGSGNTHSQIIQIREKSVRARSMGGRKADRLIILCAARALNRKSAICAVIRMESPNTARLAWGNPLARAWKYAD